MSLVWWMVGPSIGAWLAVMALVGTRTGVDVLFGMLGPLVAASVSWVMAVRTHRRSPERLTSVMITAFAAKMVFFGAYVAVMLQDLALRPVPFVVSFTSYFVALYLMEALALRRLFAGSGASR